MLSACSAAALLFCKCMSPTKRRKRKGKKICGEAAIETKKVERKFELREPNSVSVSFFQISARLVKISRRLLRLIKGRGMVQIGLLAHCALNLRRCRGLRGGKFTALQVCQ